MDTILPGLAGIPNIHPFFVHFPIVLWPTALLFFLLGSIRKKEAYFTHGRLLLYLGTIGGLFALFTGLMAGQSLGHDAPGHEFVHDHRNWMIVSMTTGMLAAIAAYASRQRRSSGWSWVVTGLLILTVLTTVGGGDRGANLVYRYGIGTAGKSLPTTDKGPSDHLHDDSSIHPSGDDHHH